MDIASFIDRLLPIIIGLLMVFLSYRQKKFQAFMRYGGYVVAIIGIVLFIAEFLSPHA